MTLQLNVEKRDIFGKKLKTSREEGKLPVVLYGGKNKTTPYFVDSSEFTKVWKEAGESTVIEIKEGDKKVADILIHATDVEPIKGHFLHADFLAVDMNKVISAHIPLAFEGISPAEKTLGGILVKVVHEIEVEALPNDLPHEIKVDLTKLVTFEDRIVSSDLRVPKEVKILAKEDEVIALVEPHKEEVEEEPTEVDMTQIEVEKKGKKEDPSDSAQGEEGGEKAGEKKE